MTNTNCMIDHADKAWLRSKSCVTSLVDGLVMAVVYVLLVLSMVVMGDQE